MSGEIFTDPLFESGDGFAGQSEVMQGWIGCYREVGRNNQLHQQGILHISVFFTDKRAAFLQIRQNGTVDRLSFERRCSFRVDNESRQNWKSQFGKLVRLPAADPQQGLVRFFVDCFFLAKIMN